MKRLAWCLLALPFAACDRAPEPDAVLLITIDTCRADRIGAYAPGWSGTPVVDALAARGALFERAEAPVPLTLPSHATILTGLYPDRHGLRDNGAGRLAGEARTLAEVYADAGWDTGAFALASELKSSEQAAALGDNKVDAIIFTVGHPNGSIQEATTTTDAHLIPVVGPVIDELVAANPYYAKAVVPGGMYRGTDADIDTFGVKATFVTSANVPDEVVYQVVKAVFDNFDRFKGLHPAFAGLTETAMISEGLSAPLHPGAEKYYKERGWLN